jgi:hypothetical protein
MFYCSLCQKEPCYIATHCEKCKKIKHLLNLYGDRVYDVLDNVLVRNNQAIEKKEQVELTSEKKKLEQTMKK